MFAFWRDIFKFWRNGSWRHTFEFWRHVFGYWRQYLKIGSFRRVCGGGGWLPQDLREFSSLVSGKHIPPTRGTCHTIQCEKDRNHGLDTIKCQKKNNGWIRVFAPKCPNRNSNTIYGICVHKLVHKFDQVWHATHKILGYARCLRISVHIKHWRRLWQFYNTCKVY